MHCQHLVCRLLLALGVAIGPLGAWPARAAPWLDETPRVAVVSAFDEELALLLSKLDAPQAHQVNGVTLTTGTLQGKPVVLLQSGVSMVNAAMNTQLVLDRFKVTHILFSGIAGGVNPALHIGDVSVPERWGQYLEVLMAREVAPGRYRAPPWMKDFAGPRFGMMMPRPVGVRSAAHPGVEHRFWFDVDAQLLAVARRIEGTVLAGCDAARQCLAHAPRVMVGGAGVSGQAFVDNAALRRWAFKSFSANVLDMESAATAQVAYSNGVPFLAFRSLSDLAGGGAGTNEMGTFMKVAADNSARVLLAFLAAWN